MQGHGAFCWRGNEDEMIDGLEKGPFPVKTGIQAFQYFPVL
jgi:hypothetical protein